MRPYIRTLVSTLVLASVSASFTAHAGPSSVNNDPQSRAFKMYLEQIQRSTQGEYQNRMREWSTGLSVDLPIEHLEQIHRTAHQNEHQNKMQEWARGLGFELP